MAYWSLLLSMAYKIKHTLKGRGFPIIKHRLFHLHFYVDIIFTLCFLQSEHCSLLRGVWHGREVLNCNKDNYKGKEKAHLNYTPISTYSSILFSKDFEFFFISHKYGKNAKYSLTCHSHQNTHINHSIFLWNGKFFFTEHIKKEKIEILSTQPKVCVGLSHVFSVHFLPDLPLNGQ